jgi:hypothetical protein
VRSNGEIRENEERDRERKILVRESEILERDGEWSYSSLAVSFFFPPFFLFFTALSPSPPSDLPCSSLRNPTAPTGVGPITPTPSFWRFFLFWVFFLPPISLFSRIFLRCDLLVSARFREEK